MATLSIRLSDKKKSMIDQLAEKTQRKKSDIVNAWIDEKLELELWQISEIKKGIAEADTGQFATEQEVQNLWSKYDV